MTYSHRVSRYGSFTLLDPEAVERFFGWAYEPNVLLRHRLFKTVCSKLTWRLLDKNCYEPLPFCEKLKADNGLVDRMVTIPEHVIMCMKEPDAKTRNCPKLLRDFTNKHPQPRTLFLTPTTLCSWKMYWSSQKDTRSWHFERYWSQKRRSMFNPTEINIALHVRRGDFLRLSHRTSISDHSYALLVRQIVASIEDAEKIDKEERDLRFRVHVYSQGLVNPSRTMNPYVRYLVRSGVCFRRAQCEQLRYSVRIGRWI